MVLSQRERYIVIGSVIAVAALGLDQFVLEPVLDAWSRTRRQKQALQAEMNRATATLNTSRLLAPKWRQMIAAGVKDDPAAAESQILHALRDWAEESRLKLSLLKPDRLPDKTQLPQISFQASGTGSMDAVARMLWKVKTAKIPIRLTEVQLASRKEGTDELTVQLRMTTLYLPAPSRAGSAARAPAGAVRSER